jgi:hypothetical protein
MRYWRPFPVVFGLDARSKRPDNWALPPGLARYLREGVSILGILGRPLGLEIRRLCCGNAPALVHGACSAVSFP